MTLYKAFQILSVFALGISFIMPAQAENDGGGGLGIFRKKAPSEAPEAPQPSQPSEAPVVENTGGGSEEAISMDVASEPDLASESVQEALAMGDGKGAYDDALITARQDPLKVALSAQQVYDSNTYLTDQETLGSWFTTFGLDVDWLGGNRTGRGVSYGVGYHGTYFLYENEFADVARDPWENKVDAHVGINGAYTSVKLSGDYYRNNGNAVDFTVYDRETRRVASDDWGVNLAIDRRLSQGTVAATVYYDWRDLERDVAYQQPLNDYETLAGDVVWYYDPAWLPKTSLGVGVGLGQIRSENNPDQRYVDPSLRMRYRYSPKTLFYGQVGYDFREFDGDGALDNDGNLSYTAGAAWQITTKTTFDLKAYRSLNPSAISFGQNYDAQGVSLSGSWLGPWDTRLTGLVGYETAEYYATSVETTGFDRNDDYLRTGMEIDKMLPLTSKLDGSIGVFYYYHENRSNDDGASFDSNTYGVKASLVY